RWMASSKETVRSVPPSVRVIFAGSFSLPLSLPDLMAASTAASISRCECTPTCLRNLRMLMLNASWFIAASASLRGGGDGHERVLERVFGERVHVLGQDLGLRGHVLW